ncbi:hypothetical protein V6N12_059217 [Hibiscus sabdariffa]|uniref:Uncharacterized protein n=1 Tax=Hibiscus sabdariffa TaxID=183260 RepID=A0ABR2EUE8_9ROSI
MESRPTSKSLDPEAPEDQLPPQTSKVQNNNLQTQGKEAHTINTKPQKHTAKHREEFTAASGRGGAQSPLTTHPHGNPQSITNLPERPKKGHWI